jgi:hypothetical protein
VRVRLTGIPLIGNTGKEGGGGREGRRKECVSEGEGAEMDGGCNQGIFYNYSLRIPQHVVANVGTYPLNYSVYI